MSTLIENLILESSSLTLFAALITWLTISLVNDLKIRFYLANSITKGGYK